MLIATNSGRTVVWKFNPSHDARGRFATRGGGGGGGGGRSAAGKAHFSASQVSPPKGVTTSSSFDKIGPRGPIHTTIWTGPKGRVELLSDKKGHFVMATTNTPVHTAMYGTKTVQGERSFPLGGSPGRSVKAYITEMFTHIV